MIKQGEKERRAFFRLNLYHLAKLKLISEPKEDEQPILASVKDIGGGGVRLRLDKSLPLGALVQLFINFPGAPQAIPIVAKVIWVKKAGKRTSLYEAGVQFLEIEDFFRDKIAGRILLLYKKFKK